MTSDTQQVQVDDRTIYLLQPSGHYRKGEEVLHNRWYASFQGACDYPELRELAQRVCKFLNTPVRDCWRPIETLDRGEYQFVLVTDDKAVRLHLWNPTSNSWERPFPLGSLVLEYEDCSTPTHWRPIPHDDIAAERDRLQALNDSANDEIREFRRKVDGLRLDIVDQRNNINAFKAINTELLAALKGLAAAEEAACENFDSDEKDDLNDALEIALAAISKAESL